jgi:hypothetical protein
MHINELDALIRLMERNSRRKEEPFGRKFLDSDGSTLNMNIGDLMSFLHNYYDPFVAGKITFDEPERSHATQTR